jgi:hypothetical protein
MGYVLKLAVLPEWVTAAVVRSWQMCTETRKWHIRICDPRFLSVFTIILSNSNN